MSSTERDLIMSNRPKEKTPCRDCGYELEKTARGCPRCAMNMEAERMIERFVAGVLLVVALIIVGIIYVVVR
jgi:hypothetical protein